MEGARLIDLETEQVEIDKIRQRINYLEVTVSNEQEALDVAANTLARTQEAQEILQLLAQAVQQQAHARISKVVSSCLSVVFEEEAYEFQIKFERKRGRTEAQLQFKRGELEVDPLTASGGGMVDVAAFALRVACLMLHRPRLSPVIIADEPFRFVSAQYRENVKLMLEGLSRDTGIQIIMVTHSEELQTGKIIVI